MRYIVFKLKVLITAFSLIYLHCFGFSYGPFALNILRYFNYKLTISVLSMNNVKFLVLFCMLYKAAQ